MKLHGDNASTLDNEEQFELGTAKDSSGFQQYPGNPAVQELIKIKWRISSSSRMLYECYSCLLETIAAIDVVS